MRKLYKLKMAVLQAALFTLAIQACALPATPPEKMTPERLLGALVQIAKSEDLTDRERIGKLLGFTIQLQPDVAIDPATPAIAPRYAVPPADPGYFSKYEFFYYSQNRTVADRVDMIIHFDDTRICLPITDVMAAFSRLDKLRIHPPPMDFTMRYQDRTTQHYGYGLTPKNNDRVSLSFAYRSCLQEISFSQY